MRHAMPHTHELRRGAGRRLAAALVSALALASSAPATAQAPANPDQTCPAPEPTQDKWKQLRALSLELRGHPPSAAEYEALDEHDAVPEAWLEEWTQQEAFADRVVRWHRGLFWNNISNENLINPNMRLRRAYGNRVYWRGGGVAVTLRGGNVPCLNQRASFDDDGAPVLTEDGQGRMREGWVEVQPYWNPEATVRVCAFDANPAMLSASGTPCGQRETMRDSSCGCGPNLRWCGTGQTNRTVLESMGEQLDSLVRDMVLQSRSYASLFEEQRARVNGPLAHYWRHQTQVGAVLRNEPAPMPARALPELGFDREDKWVEADLGEHMAGALTMPAFLLKFQTNRARANQFYTKFLCQPFQPPAGGITTDEEAGRTEPDLQKRAGCKYCHGQLEPAASHWGRWRERSAGYLAPEDFPAFRAECAECARTGTQCSRQCRQHYVVEGTQDESIQPYAGYLDAYLWRAPKHEPNVERGPALLASKGFASGQLTECVARRSAERLLGRELTGAEEDELLPELVRRFASSEYRYADLILAIVTSDVYRRVR